jgi:hypothetical protein
MSKRRALLWLTPWLLAAGCFGGDTGTEVDRAECGDRGSEEAVDQDTQTPHGSARMLARRATVENDLSVKYIRHQSGSSVNVTSPGRIRVLPDASTARQVAHHDRVDKERVCQPSLEMNAVIELHSDDGAFAERFQGTLEADQSGVVVHGRLSYDERAGSYQTDHHEGAKERVFQIRLWLRESSFDMQSALWSGNLTLEAPGVKGGVSAAIAEL